MITKICTFTVLHNVMWPRVVVTWPRHRHTIVYVNHPFENWKKPKQTNNDPMSKLCLSAAREDGGSLIFNAMLSKKNSLSLHKAFEGITKSHPLAVKLCVYNFLHQVLERRGSNSLAEKTMGEHPKNYSKSESGKIWLHHSTHMQTTTDNFTVNLQTRKIHRQID